MSIEELIKSSPAFDQAIKVKLLELVTKDCTEYGKWMLVEAILAMNEDFRKNIKITEQELEKFIVFSEKMLKKIRVESEKADRVIEKEEIENLDDQLNNL